MTTPKRVLPSSARPPGPRAEDVLGPLEADCLRVLWAQGPSSVTAVLADINRDRLPPLAYTTVMTVLARLHRKGLADRAPHGRGFVYRAALTEQEVVDRCTAGAVDAVLARYGEAALRHFATRLGDLDPELRSALEQLAATRDRPV